MAKCFDDGARSSNTAMDIAEITQADDSFEASGSQAT
jgi:hypothetical protein